MGSSKWCMNDAEVDGKKTVKQTERRKLLLPLKFTNNSMDDFMDNDKYSLDGHMQLDMMLISLIEIHFSFNWRKNIQSIC